jgi:uncharacterized protein
VPADSVCRRPPEVCFVTPQEEQLLNSLAQRVNQTQLQEKDPEAEAFLNKAFGGNPDALYILAQTVLVQNIALEQAKAQIVQLQQAQQAQLQAPQPARATSFLGSLLGHRDPAPQPQQTYAPGPPQQAYVPPPPPPTGYAQVQYEQPQYVASGQPSFLRGAMQTAAGVAAGALAFEGVEAVLHGLGGFGRPEYGFGGPGMGGFGMGPGMMGAGLERPVEETVVNNYYDEPGRQQDFGGRGEERHFHESSDQSGDRGGAQFSDASYNTSGDDRDNYDDSNDSSYDSSQDSSSDFDDGGGSSDDGGSGGDLL